MRLPSTNPNIKSVESSKDDSIFDSNHRFSVDVSKQMYSIVSQFKARHLSIRTKHGKNFWVRPSIKARLGLAAICMGSLAPDWSLPVVIVGHCHAAIDHHTITSVVIGCYEFPRIRITFNFAVKCCFRRRLSIIGYAKEHNRFEVAWVSETECLAMDYIIDD